MRILWVKAGGLVPPDTGGKIRSYNILRELARQHSVTFFTFYAAHPDDQHPKLNQMFEKAICIPLALPPPKGARELMDYTFRLFSTDPYNISKYCRPQVKSTLCSLLKDETFDVMLCDFLVAAGAIPWEWTGPKVLFTHNVEARIWERHYKVASNPLWKALSWREWKATQRAEQHYLRKADHVLAVSEADRQAFLNFLESSNVSVIPTGVDIDYFQPQTEPENDNCLIFTGSLDWLPNEDAMFYFVEQVLPRIRDEIPEVSLTIVGRKPSRRLEVLTARVRNVQLTGWVEDIRPYLARGAVCIVPLRIGGGTRIKIFEAMAMAKAVVSTTIGAEGLPVKDGEDILLADGVEQFATQTVELLRNSTLRRQIASAAHKMVREQYSWRSVADRFASVLQKVASTCDLPPNGSAYEVEKNMSR